jgi:hypothetical protein
MQRSSLGAKPLRNISSHRFRLLSDGFSFAARTVLDLLVGEQQLFTTQSQFPAARALFRDSRVQPRRRDRPADRFQGHDERRWKFARLAAGGS